MTDFENNSENMEQDNMEQDNNSNHNETRNENHNDNHNKEKHNDSHISPNNDHKKNKIRNDLKKSHDEVNFLKKELHKKQEKIESLERQINIINENFKTEVIKKAQDAQVQLQQKIKEYQDKYDTELKHAKKYTLKSSAVELLDIISNLEMAVNSKSSNPEIVNYLKGFQMFISMFKNFLTQNGINEITIKENDDFNAETMQAFDTEKKDGTPSNKVIKVVKKGYKLHDIVIVPATVIVSE